MEFSFGIFDWNFIDARFTATHQTLFVKFPEFISVCSKPLSGCVVILVLKTNGDPVFRIRPEGFGEAVVFLGRRCF